MAEEATPERIPIPIIDGRGHIFDLSVLKLLREKYSLPGVLAGTLPQYPQQNIFNGLPLQLLPEEVKYLLDTGEFYLRDDTISHQDIEGLTEPENARTVSIPAKTPSSLIKNASTSPFFIKPNEEQYNMFKYLVDRNFFVLPGLRFGCQYMAYPGDYMRYHSHYNVLGTSYDEPFDIIDVVNGGRLATSVKKCWVIGAENENDDMEVFSIEWAGFG